MYLIDRLLNKTDPEVVIYHNFKKPPWGGGNQFLLALKKQLEKKGYLIGINRFTRNTKVCLFNSFNFDFDEIYTFASKHPECRFIHRVDGPVSIYRGQADIAEDKKIWQVNHDIADRTIFQSKYSKIEHARMGLMFENARVIVNAADPDIFNKSERKQLFSKPSKLKIIAASWSDNPKKGGHFYRELEKQLDWKKYEFTFVGRTKENFKNITVIKPLDSIGMAKMLKNSDVYITASEDDPCSNSLIEALSCGLPSLHFNSGGHPEIVNVPEWKFETVDDVLKILTLVRKDYTLAASKVHAPRLEDVSKQYLNVFFEK